MQYVSFAACTALALATSLGAQSVSPTDRARLEGSSFTHFPLGRFHCRMQQLHADLPPGTILTGHSYRRDTIASRGRIDAFVCDMQVTISMSPNDPAHAATAFASNEGPNPVVVLPRTLVPFSSTDRPALDPAPTFDLQVTYQTPFVVPLTGGTVCVDTVIFGNSTTAGADQNFSVYLDAHQLTTNGRNEQPGLRLLPGCPAPGATTPAYATFTLWHLGASMALDMAARNGVADAGGSTRAFVAFGGGPANHPFGYRPACPLLTTTDVWFAMPGNNTATGDYDGTLAGLPLLPMGYRLWLQSGSIDLNNGDFVLGDQSTLVLPGAAPATVPSARIVNGSDHLAATGTVSLAVPVVRFP